MGSLSIHAGEWSIIVPFSMDGIEVARKFLDVLERMLEKEAEQ